jgi:hypothetical protein
MDLKTLDKRLQKLLLRDRRIGPEEVEKAAGQLEDLSDRVEPPSEEELTTLASSVAAEQAIRKERISLAVQRYHDQAELPEIEPEIEEEAEIDPEKAL